MPNSSTFDLIQRFQRRQTMIGKWKAKNSGGYDPKKYDAKKSKNTPKHGKCYTCDTETICLIVSGILLCDACIKKYDEASN